MAITMVITCHVLLLWKHLNLVITILQKQATCNLLYHDEDHTDDKMHFCMVQSSEALQCTWAVIWYWERLPKWKSLRWQHNPLCSIRENGHDDNNSIVIPNSHAVGIFYQTLLMVSIAMPFSGMWSSYPNAESGASLHTLGHLQFATTDQWCVVYCIRSIVGRYNNNSCRLWLIIIS